jgi:hypothetical protein
MNGILAWLQAQAHVAMSVIGAVLSNKPAPARQVLVYTAALVALMFVVPKIVKLVSK